MQSINKYISEAAFNDKIVSKYINDFGLDRSEALEIKRSDIIKLTKFFNYTNSRDSKVQIHRYVGDPMWHLSVSNGHIVVECHIGFFRNLTTNTNYWLYLPTEYTDINCIKKSSNKYIQSKNFLPYKNVNFTQIRKAYYFKSLTMLFKQFVNKALEMKDAPINDRKCITNFINPENLPAEMSDEAVNKKIWNDLLNKYNIDPSIDVIMLHTEDGGETFTEHNWGPLTPEVCLRIEGANNKRNWGTKYYWKIKNKSIDKFFDEWIDTVDEGTRMSLFYKGGLVD